MVFSPGQKGKGKKKTCVQNGKIKITGFKHQKAGGKDTNDPSYHKQRYIIPRDHTRKNDKEPSHHHAVRSTTKAHKNRSC